MHGHLIHIGSGPKRKDQTLPAFQSDDWREVHFEIDESVAPDLISTITNMSAAEMVRSCKTYGVRW